MKEKEKKYVAISVSIDVGGTFTNVVIYDEKLKAFLFTKTDTNNEAKSIKHSVEGIKKISQQLGGICQ